MRKITPGDRILLLFTALLASYQISFGILETSLIQTWSFTIGFGVLLVACLLLLILGFEGLNRQLVVILSTLIPLSISLGLVAELFPGSAPAYLGFSLAGFLTVGITRLRPQGVLPVVVLASVHGVAGLAITALPVAAVIQGRASTGYLLVAAGGALMGLGGLLLGFMRAGKPVLPRDTLLGLLPALLLLMTAAYLAGFRLK